MDANGHKPAWVGSQPVDPEASTAAKAGPAAALLPAWNTDRAVSFLIDLACSGLLSVAAIDPITGACHGTTFAIPGERDALAAWIESHQGKSNLHFLLNAPVPPEGQVGRSGRVRRRDLAALRGIVIDQDPQRDVEAEPG